MSISTFFAHQALHYGSTAIEPVSRVVVQSSNMLAGNEVPPIEALLHLGITGMVDERSMQEALLRHGVTLTVAGDPQPGTALGAQEWITELWNQHYFSQQELPAPHETMILTNRGLFSVENLDRILERQGYADPRVRTALANLRYEIPGSSDLVRFSVRHVFEPDLIERLGYNDEFRPILDFWHRLQGLNYPLFSGPFREQIGRFESEAGLQTGSFLESYQRVGLTDPTWAQAFWWSHWILPSPTQAYEMYFRLRPGRNRAFDPPFARDLNFGLEDLNLLLRANDYPPRFRPLLAAIAHRTPGIRFLRQLRATEVFTQEDVKELLLRQGYSDGDATVLAQSVERNDISQRRRQIEGQAKGQLGKYWQLGVIDDDTYKQLLIKHGLTPSDADDAVQLANLDLQYHRLENVLKFIRRGFMMGEYDLQSATDQMIQAGFQPIAAGTFVHDWQLERDTVHRAIPAGKLSQWACKGLITVQELQRRLTNLGYRLEDVAGIIAEARVCQANLALKAASQAEKQREAAIRQLKQQQKDAARAIVEARRQLASHGSPAQLRKWFCENHLGEPELYSRLRFLGWPDEDITRLISDCKASKGGKPGG